MSARVWRRRRDPRWFHRGGYWWLRIPLGDGRTSERTEMIVGGRRGGRGL